MQDTPSVFTHLAGGNEIKSKPGCKGGKTLLSRRGGNWRKEGDLYQQNLVRFLACSLSLEKNFLQLVGKTRPVHPGESMSTLVTGGHGRTFLVLKIHIPICEYIAFIPFEINETTHVL